nr:protein FAM65B-like isoform X5 [Biomphalaria glabrata]
MGPVCGPDPPLCPPRENHLSFGNKFGQKMAETYDIRPIRVFYQLLARVLGVPTYVPESGKTSIVTLHQFMAYFMDGESLNKLETIAEELRLLDRLSSGSTDTVLKAILTLREDLPVPTGLKMMAKLLTSGNRETQQSAASYLKIIIQRQNKEGQGHGHIGGRFRRSHC